MTRAEKTPSTGRGLAIAEQFRRRMQSGAVLTGAWSTVPHPNVMEVMARLDFDFLLIDGEHSGITTAELGALLPATELYGMPTIFRPQSQAASGIKAALDAGASGVMVPMIESAEAARAVIEACRYAPAGKRGIGPWRASGFYEGFTDYLARANDATTVIFQIESASGLERVEEIAAVDGYDALYVGPADLASSLGLPVGDRSALMLDALKRVVKAAHAAGRIAGIDVSAAATIPEMVDIGFSFFTIGSDTGFIQQAGRALCTELEDRFAAERG